MKYAPAGLITQLNSEVSTLCWCWKATRRDGQVFGFTTHDQNLTFANVTYLAETGVLATNAQSKIGASVDNMDIAGILDSVVISEEDLRGGKWDGAKIEVMLVNWNATGQRLTIQTGTIGDVTIKKLQFVAEMRSLAQQLQTTIGRTLKRRCDANFADEKCGIDKYQWMNFGTVMNVIDENTFEYIVDNNTYYSDPPTNSVAIVPKDFSQLIPQGGLLTWTSGTNSGSSIEVLDIDAPNSKVHISIPMAYEVAFGDTFTIISGCDKNFSTCKNYGNQVNFRGCPHIPGVDAIRMYPDAH